MGLTGELVRSVFSRSRSRSLDTRDTNTRNNLGDRRKWTSVRSYLCGDEFNSVLAEQDSASVKSSEATVTQPIQEDLTGKGEMQSNEIKEEAAPEEKQNSVSRIFQKDDAAVIIQAAFRSYLARRRNQEIKLAEEKEELIERKSPSWDSVATSIEVQTGNSAKLLQVEDEKVAFHQKMRHKSRTQVLRIKEEWDHSTVSSNISKMRIQNRLEAMTRRERALAYAFSQQLRICSKRKQNKSEGAEPNMGWSWLERWMATRMPETSIVDNHTRKYLEPISSTQNFLVRKRFEDVAREEKESCGSNEVSVRFDSNSIIAEEERNVCKPAKNRLKTTRKMSRRKTVPSCHYVKEYTKVIKRDYSKENEKDLKNKQKQLGSKKEAKCKDSSP